MELRITDQFLEDILQKTHDLQAKSLRLLRELRGVSGKELRSSAKKGWRLHQLRTSPFVSLSVDMAHRMLATIDGDLLILHRLVAHDVYERTSVLSNDGHEVLGGVVPSILAPADLYGALLSLGIPSERVASLRGVQDEEALLDALSVMPTELQALALSLFESTGLIWQRTRYRVFSAGDSIASLLAAPLDEWSLFLHPSQEYVVSAAVEARIAVAGAAGTGKTVCAWHRVKFILDRGHRTAFLCPNERVLEASRAALGRLLGDAFQELVFTGNTLDSIRSVLASGAPHLVVDEAQDLALDALKLLKESPRAAWLGLTIFYDVNQCVFLKSPRRDVLPAKVAEIDAALRGLGTSQTLRLHVNFRNSGEISRFVTGLLGEALPAPLDGTEISVFECGEVVSLQANSVEAAIAMAFEGLRVLRREFSDDAIGLVWAGRRISTWKTIVSALGEAGLPVRETAPGNAAGLHAMSAQWAKGHEKKALVVFLPGGIDRFSRKAPIDAYVGLTRARDRLLLIELPGEQGSL